MKQLLLGVIFGFYISIVAHEAIRNYRLKQINKRWDYALKHNNLQQAEIESAKAHANLETSIFSLLNDKK